MPSLRAEKTREALLDAKEHYEIIERRGQFNTSKELIEWDQRSKVIVWKGFDEGQHKQYYFQKERRRIDKSSSSYSERLPKRIDIIDKFIQELKIFNEYSETIEQTNISIGSHEVAAIKNEIAKPRVEVKALRELVVRLLRK